MNKNLAIVGVGIVVFFVLIWIYAGGDDKEQIASEIIKPWNDTNIHHIEMVEDIKSVAFFTTSEGTKMEMYLEKSLLSWKKKRDFSFIPEGIKSPIHLSFFDCPYSNEEEYNVVLLRVFDKEIDSVQIVKGEDIVEKDETK